MRHSLVVERYSMNIDWVPNLIWGGECPHNALQSNYIASSCRKKIRIEILNWNCYYIVEMADI